MGGEQAIEAVAVVAGIGGSAVYQLDKIGNGDFAGCASVGQQGAAGGGDQLGVFRQEAVAFVEVEDVAEVFLEFWKEGEGAAAEEHLRDDFHAAGQ